MYHNLRFGVQNRGKSNVENLNFGYCFYLFTRGFIFFVSYLIPLWSDNHTTTHFCRIRYCGVPPPHFIKIFLIWPTASKVTGGGGGAPEIAISYSAKVCIMK